MNTNTALLMFAVLAAVGLVAATLVVPIVPQAHAAPPTTGPSVCHTTETGGQAIGACARGTHGPPT